MSEPCRIKNTIHIAKMFPSKWHLVIEQMWWDADSSKWVWFDFPTSTKWFIKPTEATDA